MRLVPNSYRFCPEDQNSGMEFNSRDGFGNFTKKKKKKKETGRNSGYIRRFLICGRNRGRLVMKALTLPVNPPKEKSTIAKDSQALAVDE